MPITLELCKVTLEYAAHETFDPKTDVLPTRKVVTRNVAVFGDFGSSIIARAADLATEATLGKGFDTNKWQPMVRSVVYIGSVTVEERA